MVRNQIACGGGLKCCGLEIHKKHQLKDEIELLIRKYNMGNGKVYAVLEYFYKQQTWDLYQRFNNEYPDNRIDKKEVSDKLRKLCDRKTINYPSKEVLLNILCVQERDLNKDEFEVLNDYIYYMQNRRLRIKIF